MSKKKGRKKPAKHQKPGTYVKVEPGIFKYLDKNGDVTYHERPFLPGLVSKKGNPVRTWRSLGFNFTPQPSLKNARDEYHRRRTEVAAGRNPYEAPKPPEKPQPKPTVSEIIKNYVEKQYPDRYLQPRTGRTLESEAANCETLLGWWDGQIWDEITPRMWDKYHEWRSENVKQGCTGDSTTDKERITLSNAFKYAMRLEMGVTSNPVENFPRHHPLTKVQHCREFQPNNIDEVHEIAGYLFEDKRSWNVAFQLLFEANTGLRTEEVLMLRTDATKPGQPGYVSKDGNLHVQRVKHGVNPFVQIHPGLKRLLKAHAVWKAICHPDSPWFIPGRDPAKPAHKDALAHALIRIRKRIGRKITSHGMRAFFVLVRRSQRADDNQIAWELGDKSGGGIIASTYGDIPDNWKTGNAPQLTWLPKKAAWEPYARGGWKKDAEVHKKGWKRGAKSAQVTEQQPAKAAA